MRNNRFLLVLRLLSRRNTPFEGSVAGGIVCLGSADMLSDRRDICLEALEALEGLIIFL